MSGSSTQAHHQVRIRRPAARFVSVPQGFCGIILEKLPKWAHILTYTNPLWNHIHNTTRSQSLHPSPFHFSHPPTPSSDLTKGNKDLRSLKKTETGWTISILTCPTKENLWLFHDNNLQWCYNASPWHLATLLKASRSSAEDPTVTSRIEQIQMGKSRHDARRRTPGIPGQFQSLGEFI